MPKPDRRWRVAMVVIAALLGSVVGLAVAGEPRTITIKDHTFVPKEVMVPAHTPVTLTVTNADTAVEEFESHSLNREKLIRPGQSVKITLPALKPGRYEFFGEFHPETAQGVIVAQ